MTVPIHLLSQRPNVSESELLSLFGGAVIATDCYVVGAESWDSVIGGYERGRILNVDHHAPTERMQREISSANLAIERVRTLGLPAQDTQIVLTHTDCDSVLSAGILSGRLPADDRYGDAALAADHSGEPLPIAELLQALDDERNLELSFSALAMLEKGLELPHSVQQALAQRAREREIAGELVSSGAVQMHGPVAVLRTVESLDGSFFAPLLPHAQIILLARPHESDPAKLEVKLRRGWAAPASLTLQGLGVQQFDSAYGGRWNAGSNRRGGGSPRSLADYASELEKRVRSHCERDGVEAYGTPRKP